MNSAARDDWAALASRWQVRSEPLRLSIDDLLRRERLRRAGMALLLLSEVLISLGALLGTWTVRSMMNGGGTILLLVVILYTALVWIFMLWNRRGTWRPEEETVEGFVAILSLRARRGLRTARFTTGVVLVQAVATVLWVTAILIRKGTDALPRVLLALSITAIISAGFLLWAVWFRRLMLRRLAWLRPWQAGGERPAP
jgi:hypothetical protein